MTSIALSDGWQTAGTAPDECDGPDGLDGLGWLAAQVPGTAASALREAAAWQPGDAGDFDGQDWWFRTRFEGGPDGDGADEIVLALDGIATVSEVYLNGERVLDSDSMFAAHRIDVSGRLAASNDLVICCRALGPRLAVSRRPRARWRTRLVSHGNLRFYRTMLLGRAPGIAPGPACVGPWRPVRLERRRGLVVDELRLRSRVEYSNGTLSVRARLRVPAGAATVSGVAVELSGPSGTHTAPLELTGGGPEVVATGSLTVPGVERWWPHTHGVPALHDVRLLVSTSGEELTVSAGRVGFCEVVSDGELERDGIRLSVNGVPVFARGAVWTPLDISSPFSPAPRLRAALASVARAGMNMVRVPGVGCYESDAFYELCDELGILVWQDFMFANFDYPEQDEAFMRAVESEAREVLSSLGPRAGVAVVCGGSEVAQQVAMMGLDPKLADGPLYREVLPSLVAEAGLQATYVPSAPWGGDLPFRPDEGVAHYFGVGAYLRPLEDARRAEVKFAAESLAFSNVPDPEALAEIAATGEVPVHSPRWKAGVPRDAGAGWDFEDVRDHYLRLLYEQDPVALRTTDHDRYLELSRYLTGEVMAEVLGEWRRAGSPCSGALVLWLTDLLPGAGWGLLDHRGEPKVAYHYVRRALAPVAVWSTDEGLGGIVAHIANDRPTRLEATLRVAMYRDFEVLVEEVRRDVSIDPHAGRAVNVEELLGRFVDASWSYRFGPPAQDVIVLSLEDTTDGRPISQSFRFPAGRPSRVETAARLGLSATVRPFGDGSAVATVTARRLAYGVRIRVSGYIADDDAFSVEPGRPREVGLRRVGERPDQAGDRLTALNLAGGVTIEAEAGP